MMGRSSQYIEHPASVRSLLKSSFQVALTCGMKPMSSILSASWCPVQTSLLNRVVSHATLKLGNQEHTTANSVSLHRAQSSARRGAPAAVLAVLHGCAGWLCLMFADGSRLQMAKKHPAD